MPPKKCEFMESEVSFLGMKVAKRRMGVDSKKVEVLQNWSRTKTLTDVRGFTRLLHLFRRFIEEFGNIAKPLNYLTRKREGIDKWDANCDDAFESLKNQ